MRAMTPDEFHPDISLADWRTFSNEVSPFVIEEVIDRSIAHMPSWFLPLARGAAVPSSYLLRSAGYRPGAYRARGWRKPKRSGKREEVFKDLGRDYLIVTRCKRFWRITMDRGVLSRPGNRCASALVHMFGSTPILARTYQEATYLAELCYEKGSPGLCWVHECPDDISGAIEFAQDRNINEALAARSLLCSLAA
jgi:hypothetical protein